MSSANHAPSGSENILPDRVENARSLLVVLIIMALLAGLALLFARGTKRMGDDWRAQLAGTATLQVLHSSAAGAETEMQTAQDIVRRELSSANITALSAAESAALLRPWLGNTALPADLPVPGLITIEAELTDQSEARLLAALAEDGLRVKLDTHDRFASKINDTARQLALLGTALLVLLLGAGVAINIFATRAGLSAQRSIISVLTQVGASNMFVAKLFIGQAGKRGLVGGIIGLALAAIIWAALSFSDLADHIGWGGFRDALPDIIWLLGLAILFAAICAMAAGVTALRQLKRERRRQ